MFGFMQQSFRNTLAEEGGLVNLAPAVFSGGRVDAALASQKRAKEVLSQKNATFIKSQLLSIST